MNEKVSHIVLLFAASGFHFGIFKLFLFNKIWNYFHFRSWLVKYGEIYYKAWLRATGPILEVKITIKKNHKMFLDIHVLSTWEIHFYVTWPKRQWKLLLLALMCQLLFLYRRCTLILVRKVWRCLSGNQKL